SVMIDVGANVHPKPEHLFHYGLMGSVFAKQRFNRPHPTIGLLNVGSEDSKGNELAKETARLFQQSTLRDQFKGNIEGRDISAGSVDVIVCDGFVGNVVLKCCEGMVEFLMKAVSKHVIGSLNVEKEQAKQALFDLHNQYHYSEFGGAPLLGIDGVCLICHGSSDARALRNAVRAAKEFNKLNERIMIEMKEALRDLQTPAAE
ncbi:MAG: phosphate acyltransferase PlsX, partial [Planctomycetia bacterium]